MDLLDWHRGRLSSRRLAVLIRHLPRDSALNRELLGEAVDWSVTDYLLAHVVDHLAVANWMFATINRDEDADPLDPPEPVARPGIDGEHASEDTLEDAAAESPAEIAPGPTAIELAGFFA
ncbi:hypothetical protein P3T36_003192 [Kitasatospora sp. MAP12-15]|uniref:hypothetical protein n=1 Tax=unclassified Kitasatospora TaxID=2633591 RepID=UPI002473C128|nr:hypothetical protein [Kitasatospora sp. MAP12-44]MDH6111168.1 hypothetical protein [Kitasatospora sp. MAP12-44]